MNHKTIVYVMDTECVTLTEEEVLPMIAQAYAEKVMQSKNDLIRKQELYTGYLLYQYLNITQNDSIHYNLYGKPYCKDRCFSISHSGKYVVLATSDGEIGVDIENGTNVSLGALKRILSEKEYTELEKILENADEENLVFQKGRLWCETEAILKAMGKGFYFDPRNQDYKKGWYLQTFQLEQYVLVCAQKERFEIEMIFV